MKICADIVQISALPRAFSSFLEANASSVFNGRKKVVQVWNDMTLVNHDIILIFRLDNPFNVSHSSLIKAPFRHPHYVL